MMYPVVVNFELYSKDTCQCLKFLIKKFLSNIYKLQNYKQNKTQYARNKLKLVNVCIF